MTTPPNTATVSTVTPAPAPAPAPAAAVVVDDDDDDDDCMRDCRSSKYDEYNTVKSKQLASAVASSSAPPSSFSSADANAGTAHQSDDSLSDSSINKELAQGKSAVDFIGPSSAVKHLFSLPYNSDRSVSVACHNIGNGTLLLDSWEDDYFGVVSASPTSDALRGGGGVGANWRGSSARSSMRGRRRQRPSWSIKQNDDNDERTRRALSLYESTIGDEDDHDDVVETFESNQMQQIALLRENERSLLASLSLLLEEEVDKKKDNSQGSEQRQNPSPLNEECGSNNIAHILPLSPLLKSPSNAIIVSSTSSSLKTSNDVGGTTRVNSTETMDESTEPTIFSSGSVPVINNKPKNAIIMGQEENSNDPLLGTTLHPPQDYLSRYAGVSLPNPPRQYVNWKFRDMKLLIGSDAIIYDSKGIDGGGGGKMEGTGKGEGEEIKSPSEGGKKVLRQRSLDDFEEEEGTMRTMTTTAGSSSTIAILIADASELKSQMINNMVKKKMEDDRQLSDEEQGGINERRALPPPPSSYAEALLMTPPSSLTFKEEVEAEVEREDCDAAMNNVVKLQTCIIPTSVVGPEWANEWASRLGFSLSPLPSPPTSAERGGVEKLERSATTTTASSGVCTVLDAYLDNIMANVPQLALILREHGYVQNIKLMRTEDIPSLMMHPSTLGSFEMNTESSSATATIHPPPSEVFSPDIVEMNAAMLLQFLKSNCTSENSTFLVHRAAGETNIQLFDISSISQMRHRKWTWWLALCGYRFACRLEQLVKTSNNILDDSTRREYRNRQRSLLQNTLDLLEELVDMNDDDDRNAQRRRHDTIGAAVCEHLADTFLWNHNDVDVHSESDQRAVDSSSSKSPEPYASCQVRYGRVTVDSLNKAHDHLMSGVKKLTPLLSKARQDKSLIEIEAISTQLYGLHHKLINVNLRLSDRHLQNYFASNLIQSLRTSARILSETIPLLGGMFQGSHPMNKSIMQKEQSNMTDSPFDIYARSILLQYAWLWEYCGHFARSFAADGLWRDRGHTCGQDLIGLFREVNNFCSGIRKRFFGAAAALSNPKPELSVVSVASHGQVSLKNTLSGIVILPKDFEQIETSVLQKEGCHEAIGAAKFILDQKTEIKRDARLVLVAASVCYGHAIDAYVFLASHSSDSKGGVDCDEKHINLISVASNVVTTVAPLLRQRLGDACNEIGKVLLQESRAVLSPQFTPPGKKIGMSKNNFGKSHVSAIMLISAQFWFLEGLQQFTSIKDLRNIALLRCNLCQCCKIRANTNVVLPEEEDSSRNNSESYLQEAVDHLIFAHNAMGQRDADPITWDMVSDELAATLLVLGVRRRQSTLSSSSEPLLFQAMRLTPGAEKAIVEPMERSYQIYESLGTPRASHQAAASHYQLALYFSKVWTCQRDEAKTREKLAAAFKHYGLAHQYFFQHIEGNESTFIVLSLDFSNLYSAVSGEECLSKALLCCLDTRMAFSIPVAPAVTKQMATLADNVEARVSKLLLCLVKIEKENNSKLKAGQKTLDKYKNMYRTVLAHKMLASANVISQSGGERSQPIFELLTCLLDLSKA